jgi:hypothetical protein
MGILSAMFAVVLVSKVVRDREEANRGRSGCTTGPERPVGKSRVASAEAVTVRL